MPIVEDMLISHRTLSQCFFRCETFDDQGAFRKLEHWCETMQYMLQNNGQVTWDLLPKLDGTVIKCA
jgi:hypothetical protein